MHSVAPAIFKMVFLFRLESIRANGFGFELPRQWIYIDLDTVTALLCSLSSLVDTPIANNIPNVADGSSLLTNRP